MNSVYLAVFGLRVGSMASAQAPAPARQPPPEVVVTATKLSGHV